MECIAVAEGAAASASDLPVAFAVPAAAAGKSILAAAAVASGKPIPTTAAGAGKPILTAAAPADSLLTAKLHGTASAAAANCLHSASTPTSRVYPTSAPANRVYSASTAANYGLHAASGATISDIRQPAE